MSIDITTRFEQEAMSGRTAILVKVAFDKSLMESVETGEFAGLGSRVAQEIASKLYPEMEKRLLEDPATRELILKEVITNLGSSLSKRLEDAFKPILVTQK